MKVPFFSDRPSNILRNVDIADSSTGLGDLILGEIASSKASQKVLPSTSLTRTICNDFSREPASNNINNYISNPLSLSLMEEIYAMYVAITLKNCAEQRRIFLNFSS